MDNWRRTRGRCRSFGLKYYSNNPKQWKVRTPPFELVLQFILPLTSSITDRPLLPMPLRVHCMVQINKTHFFMAGGKNSSGSKTTQAWVMEWNTCLWTQLPDMNHARNGHICQLMNSDKILGVWGKNKHGKIEVSCKIIALMRKRLYSRRLIWLRLDFFVIMLPSKPSSTHYIAGKSLSPSNSCLSSLLTQPFQKNYAQRTDRNG